MRRRLFLRVYLSFCLAMLAAGLAFVAVSATVRRDPLSAQWAKITNGALLVSGQVAASRYEAGDASHSDAFLAQVARATRLKIFLFDASGNLLGPSHGMPPPPSRDLAIKALHSLRDGEPVFVPFQLSGAYSLRDTTTGRRFAIVAQIPGSPGRNLMLPILRMIAAMGISALICYGLTRSVTDPILALRRGAHRLAEGDLTARVSDTPAFRKRQDEIAELGHDFDRMAERLEASTLAQRRLLADISHELRSPLARLVVALELARQRYGVFEAGLVNTGKPLARIEREAERMNELIEQLLTLARLEGDAGRAASEVTPVDLGRLVREVVQDADFEARAHNRGCEAILPGAPLPLFVGDAELLRRAVENVVRNAVRYTAEGTSVAVTLAASLEGGTVITVRDHGPGVPEESLPELFRPFWRVADARERATGGTGLGLAIADRALRWHGGTIRAENAVEGGGLIVTLMLPRL